MKNDILIINVIASVFILLATLCYFALQPNDDLARAHAPIHVAVNAHGYQPAMIQAQAGKEIKLRIVRDNVETCKSGIEFPQLNVAYPFMLDIPINVTIPPLSSGIIDFNCRDGGARGRIVLI